GGECGYVSAGRLEPDPCWGSVCGLRGSGRAAGAPSCVVASQESAQGHSEGARSACSASHPTKGHDGDHPGSGSSQTSSRAHREDDHPGRPAIGAGDLEREGVPTAQGDPADQRRQPPKAGSALGRGQRVTSLDPELEEYPSPGGCVCLVCYKPG